MRIVRTKDDDFAQQDAAGLRLYDRAPWLGGKLSGALVPGPVPLGVPVTPSKIICVGRNYRAHAKELGHEVPKEPLLFFKPPSSLLPSGGTLVLPAQSQRIEHEAELGVVIGERLKHAGEDQCARAIYGLVAVCDVTARDLQKSDGQWTRAKGFDTFCPVSDAVVTGEDWRERDVICRVNGAVRQNGNTRDMVFSVPALLAYASTVMTLEPGDLLVTGTPEGVGPLLSGDVLEVEVSGVGKLSVECRSFSST